LSFSAGQSVASRSSSGIEAQVMIEGQVVPDSTWLCR
jgi:hypothetical protein